MVYWEHKIVELSREKLEESGAIKETEDYLNDIGKNGWHILSKIHRKDGVFYHMEREISCKTCRIYPSIPYDKKKGRLGFSGHCMKCLVRIRDVPGLDNYWLSFHGDGEE